MLLPIIMPFAAALAVLLVGKRARWFGESLSLIIAVVNAAAAISLFKTEGSFVLPWAGFGMDFALRAYQFGNFILLGIAFFALAIALYSIKFMRGREAFCQFYAYLLITLSFANGVALSDNFVLFLFFWEGLLITLFGFIAIGGRGAYRTAIKGFIINGITDLCMMVGIAMAGSIAGTLTISQIHVSIQGLGGLAFILIMIGAISKAGSMPFHTWIPDAAIDAPLPFMAILPASIEKLLGIYLLARISLDVFKMDGSSWASTLLMVIGSITIVFAVMMALVQKDYKKLLSFHAISQVGYMILGIGTCLPIGIIGGVFHMINHALYKSCLFLTGGSVEKQAGTTDLSRLGGLAAKMPITFICFVIAAMAISGVPPLNGFFSKEFVYDAALERNVVFYIAAALGSFFTAASFLKLGHAAFLGKVSDSNKGVKEAHITMLVPMIAIAAVCVFFGVYRQFPLQNFIQPILAGNAVQDFSGMQPSTFLVLATVLILVGALLHHLISANLAGSGYKALDHIRNTKRLSRLYDLSEQRAFDLYEIGMKFAGRFAVALWGVDRGIDWIYNVMSVRVGSFVSTEIKKAHCGNCANYIVWSVVAAVLVIMYMLS
jgi:NADH-quinone oxidoreductase subunit L